MQHICICVHDPLNSLSHKPHPLLLIWYLLSNSCFKHLLSIRSQNQFNTYAANPVFCEIPFSYLTLVTLANHPLQDPTETCMLIVGEITLT